MININNKRWDKINGHDIKKVLSGDDGESFFYEFKSDDVNAVKLIKEISAFANTYGGYIFLGINDDKTISGCKRWTEQRIHSSIHDSLTPTPNFDVRRFKVEGKTIFVIKVEEGILPPYITRKGAIYERLSSGSFPIMDSARLTQLYNKRVDQEKCVRSKIEFSEIDTTVVPADNLCGYIDIGFSVTCSDYTFLQKNLYTIDLSTIARDILETNSFSISRVANAFVFTIGEISSSNSGNTNYRYPVGLHNYLVINEDCSISCRMLLYSYSNGNNVDISVLPIIIDIFKKIYTTLCGEDFGDIFIHAQKYEKLTVLKQFVPVYEIERHIKELEDNPFQHVLRNHREKYGENLIVQGNRVPPYGYSLIDKRWFDKSLKTPYSRDALIDVLFNTAYIHLGYIDSL